ncbi:MAG: DUF333 domain-containing protein [Oligoflexia bacterium]|nr:DUF333 domain-containing protein [Oligoflexia bacterium]
MRIIFTSMLLFVSCFTGLVSNAEAIPNPASKNCVRLGGTLTIVKLQGNDGRFNGGEIGICFFGRGIIEEWTLFRYVVSGKEQKAVHVYFNPAEVGVADDSSVVGIPSPAAKYCQEQGGKSVTVIDQVGAQSSLCEFSDRSMIDEWTLFRGFKDEVNKKLTAVLQKHPRS